MHNIRLGVVMMLCLFFQEMSCSWRVAVPVAVTCASGMVGSLYLMHQQNLELQDRVDRLANNVSHQEQALVKKLGVTTTMLDRKTACLEKVVHDHNMLFLDYQRQMNKQEEENERLQGAVEKLLSQSSNLQKCLTCKSNIGYFSRSSSCDQDCLHLAKR